MTSRISEPLFCLEDVSVFSFFAAGSWLGDVEYAVSEGAILMDQVAGLFCI